MSTGCNFARGNNMSRTFYSIYSAPTISGEQTKGKKAWCDLAYVDKINDRIKGRVVTSARSPNTTSGSRPQLIHHYALLQSVAVNTHNTQQDRRPASVCLNIPCIRHAGMLTSLCTIVNVCLCPPPFLCYHIVSAGLSVCVCVCVCGV